MKKNIINKGCLLILIHNLNIGFDKTIIIITNSLKENGL